MDKRWKKVSEVYLQWKLQEHAMRESSFLVVNSEEKDVSFSVLRVIDEEASMKGRVMEAVHR